MIIFYKTYEANKKKILLGFHALHIKLTLFETLFTSSSHQSGNFFTGCYMLL